MKWKSFGSVVVLVLFILYPLQKEEVTNLSKIMWVASPFSLIDSSALVEPKTDRATTRALVSDFLPVSTTNQIVKHQYLFLSCNEEYEQAEWVCLWVEKSSYVKNNNFKRLFFVKTSKLRLVLLTGEIIKVIFW
jgi:hypothetical protein